MKATANVEFKLGQAIGHLLCLTFLICNKTIKHHLNYNKLSELLGRAAEVLILLLLFFAITKKNLIPVFVF